MLSTEDPLHFINSLNTKGQSALYIAAKNGNAEVVKLLIENNVNHLIKSKVIIWTNFLFIFLKGKFKWIL